MMFGVRLPYQRRRSRWDQLLQHMPNQAELLRRLLEAERLRDSLPDRAHLRERVQPFVQRAAAALPDPPAFLQESLHLDRIPQLNRRQPSSVARILNAPAPLWLVVAGVIGGLIVGITIAQSGRRRHAAVDPERLEAAAEQIKDTWPAIVDEDIREAHGNIARLSSVIGERTGEDTRTVRERLVSLTSREHSENGNR